MITYIQVQHLGNTEIHTTAQRSVPAFALCGLCGRIGPPILGGRHFRGNEILPNLQNFIVIIYLQLKNKNLQRSSVL